LILILYLALRKFKNHLYGFRKRLFDKNLEKNQLKQLNSIKKIMMVSDSIKLDVIKDAMNLEDDQLKELVKSFADKFGFRIQENHLILDNNNVLDFIDELESQFKVWAQREVESFEKV